MAILNPLALATVLTRAPRRGGASLRFGGVDFAGRRRGAVAADPWSAALVWGLAVVTAIAAHASVIRMLWWSPVSAPPRVTVPVQLVGRPQLVERPQLIERQPPVVPQIPPLATTPAPQLPIANDPKPRHRPAPRIAEQQPAPAEPKPEAKPALRTASGPDVEKPPPPSPRPATTNAISRPAKESAPSREIPALPAAGPRDLPELAVHCPRRPPPRYPAAARRLGEEGIVELRVALSARGAVDRVTVIRSSGSDRLDRAAVAAVRNWRCEPARVGGVAAPATAMQRIRFSLR